MYTSSYVDTYISLSEDKESCKLLEESIFQCASMALMQSLLQGILPLVLYQYHQFNNVSDYSVTLRPCWWEIISKLHHKDDYKLCNITVKWL